MAGAVLLAAVFAWLQHVAPGQEVATLAELIKPGAAAGYNVLLVTLDTVRQDRLGCYGYRLAETPTCDALAAEGVLYADAVTSVPLTLPSHATLLTGLYPPHHGVRDNGTYHLSADHPTLATTLKAHGYDTAAFVGCFVVDARFGLSQGFDVYDFQVTLEGYRPNRLDYNERPANAVTDAAIGWLNQRRQAGAAAPFFMWVHYFDAHLPYTSPLTHEPRFAGRGYDAEIAFADQNLGRLRAELERQGLWQKTIVVLTADHGECLGEHKEPTHGMLLYNAAVRVPLIFSCPTLFTHPARIGHDVVGLVDVRPTIEDLLGLPLTQPVDGQSLVRRSPNTARTIYLETMEPLALAGWSPLYAMLSHTSKYILAPEREYYDLHADPKEVNNLYPEKAAALATLSRELEQTAHSSAPGNNSERAVSEEEIKRLASLGYVRFAAAEPTEKLADPKAMMDVYNKALTAEDLYSRGQFGSAAALAQEVLTACDQCIQARRVLAFSRLKLGQASEVISLLRGAVTTKPDVYLIRSLAQALILNGDLGQAWETLALYESLDPADGRVPLLRGDIHARQGHLAEAIESYEAAIRLDENRVGIMARQRIERLKQDGAPQRQSSQRQLEPRDSNL